MELKKIQYFVTDVCLFVLIGLSSILMWLSVVNKNIFFAIIGASFWIFCNIFIYNNTESYILYKLKMGE